MQASWYRLAAVALFCLSIAGCGSTSKLTREDAAASHDFTRYERIVIGDFASRPRVAIPERKRAVYDAEVAAAGQRFSQMVVDAMRHRGVRSEIVRGARNAGALHVDGEITRYADGNAALRFLIGMGAGSSYFDATVRFSDGSTGETLGAITVDKNSWPLGGLVAAAQDADAHMQGAAAKVAEEIARAQGIEPPPARERTTRRKARPPVGCARGGCKGD